MKKKTKKLISKVLHNIVMAVGIVVLGFFVLGILSYSYDKITEEETSVERYSNYVVEDLSFKELKKPFIQGCVIDPRLDDYCECAWGVITDTYTEDEFLDAFYDYIETGEYPRELMETTISCLGK